MLQTFNTSNACLVRLVSTTCSSDPYVHFQYYPNQLAFFIRQNRPLAYRHPRSDKSDHHSHVFNYFRKPLIVEEIPTRDEMGPALHCIPNHLSIPLRTQTLTLLPSSPITNGKYGQVSSAPIYTAFQPFKNAQGRGIYVLQETLPDFFAIGLITSVNADGTPNTAGGISTPNIPFLEPDDTRQDADAHIYSPHVRLSYTPPLQLPAPFPKTFHIDGMPATPRPMISLFIMTRPPALRRLRRRAQAHDECAVLRSQCFAHKNDGQRA